MVDAAILAQARTARATLLDKSCAVQRNSAGTWGTVATVACAKAARGAQGDANLPGHVRQRGEYVFSLPVTADVRPQDRLVEGGSRYRVLDPDAALASGAVDRSLALCRRVAAVDEDLI